MCAKRLRRRGRRVVGVVLGAAATLGLAVLLVLWLMFQHRPAWYSPARLNEAGIQQARSEATELADSLGDRMARGRPFEVVLIDRKVNEWLAALPHCWPEARRSVPSEISEPAVRFNAGRMHAGAHCESGGWRAIINVELALGVSEDGMSIEIALFEARGGSLQIPRAILGKLLDPLLRGVGDASSRSTDPAGEFLPDLGDVGSVDDLFRGVKIRNRFVWGNGDRPFRIDSITIGEGELRLGIEPL